MNLPGTTYTGPEIDDPEVLEGVPSPLRALLGAVNGLVAFQGGLHVRGACTTPGWHSLRRAWFGEASLHQRYRAIKQTDVPFAQDAVGDQWILREERIWQLESETGALDATDFNLGGFLDAATQDPVETLGLHPLLQFQADGGRLQPGELLNVYPPFCTAEAANGVSLRAVPADERLEFLSQLARRLPPDGSFEVTFE